MNPRDKPKPKRPKGIMVRVPLEVYDALKEQAEREMATLSYVAFKALLRGLEETLKEEEELWQS